jgi:hypothetical protein
MWQSPRRNNYFPLVIKTFHSIHKQDPYCSLLAPTNLFGSLKPLYTYIGNMFFYFNPKDAESSIINQLMTMGFDSILPCGHTIILTYIHFLQVAIGRIIKIQVLIRHLEFISTFHLLVSFPSMIF